jgi:thiol-disulfide isomerase/thioredoxin
MVASANLVEIGSTAAFNTLVSRLGPQQLLVLDFHATWCGPCHAIAPIYEQLAKANPQTQFAKIDVDAQRELASYYKITAMPSFKFIKGPNKDNVVGEIRGADPRKLAQLVQDHSGPAAKFAPAAAAAPAAPQAPADVSLLPHVSATGLSCLGESKDHPLSSIVGPEAGPKGRSYLESDIDPELLISIQVSTWFTRTPC